jgi:hypothetical protein
MSFAREQLAALLAGGAAREAFSASMSAPASDLQLEVRGVGPIGLPVSQAQARQLCGVARPASYGRGAETLLDRGVRDTWVVPKSRVKIDGRRWNKALRPALDRLGRDLGLPAGSELRAEFHSMLVYARGQFFVSHQDSEKDDAMIASLVVGLPSSFEGGALVVRHGGETLIYRGSKEKLSLLAFYSDCRHEVEPVTSGYRVVLTYNLLLRRGADASSADLDPALVDGVARCLEEHFASSDRLVYLLDHEYTRRGLGRARLKGADARRASLLAAAAERARCEHTLALADVHETWSAYEPDDRYRRWRDWEDVGLDDGGDYELEEMIESEVALESWIAASGAIEEVALFVSDAELCATTPSGELEPYASEYEGYMGNWGNTLDRWYHRGAIVVWPRSRAFVVRAEASPGWALDELAARAERGDLASARTAVQSLAPLWGRVAARAQTTGLLASTLRVAQVIGEPQSATLLLQPFRLQTVGASHAAELSGLAAGYGEEWAAGLVTLWSSSLAARPYVADEDTLAWIASLPRLCLALRGAGGAGVTTAGLLIDAAWRWLSEAIDRDRRLPSPSRREQALQALGAPLVAIVQSAARLIASACAMRRSHCCAVTRSCSGALSRFSARFPGRSGSKSTPSPRAAARSWPAGWRVLSERPPTGRSSCLPGAIAVCAPRLASSCGRRTAGRTSGGSPRTGVGTCISASTRPSSRCATRLVVSDVRTRWC